MHPPQLGAVTCEGFAAGAPERELRESEGSHVERASGTVARVSVAIQECACHGQWPLVAGLPSLIVQGGQDHEAKGSRLGCGRFARACGLRRVVGRGRYFGRRGRCLGVVPGHAPHGRPTVQTHVQQHDQGSSHRAARRARRQQWRRHCLLHLRMRPDHWGRCRRTSPLPHLRQQQWRADHGASDSGRLVRVGHAAVLPGGVHQQVLAACERHGIWCSRMEFVCPGTPRGEPKTSTMRSPAFARPSASS